MYIWFNIDCRVKMILLVFLLIVKIVVLLVNMNKLLFDIDFGRLFIKIENNFGFSIEFWGILYVMVLGLD